MPGNIPSVVFINHWAKNPGGAERSLLDIISCMLTRAGVGLITSEPGWLIVEASRLGVECRIVPCSLAAGKNIREHFLREIAFSPRAVISYFRFVISLSRYIKTIKPDIIHANVPLSHMSLFFLTLFGYRGKCVFHIREIFKRNSLPFHLYQWLFPRSRGHVIAISEAVKEHLPSALQKKSIVLYNGVRVPEVANARNARTDRITSFLYLGRIVPWKGCHRLIRIFAMINNRCSKDLWELSLIGDTAYWGGGYRDYLQEQIKVSGLESNCFLLPHTDNPENAFRGHDVFVNASCEEPFGRSIAEAQAMGLPVIAFDSGGIREIVVREATGILVPYGDLKGFARAVWRIMENPDMASEMGQKGRERMKKHFDRDIQMPKICDELLSGELA